PNPNPFQQLSDQAFARRQAMQQSCGDPSSSYRRQPMQRSSGQQGYSIPQHDDLLSNIRMGKEMLKEVMQKVPLFDFQCGAIIFNPVGVVAIETFDHPMSWEAIKKEVIEKHGDKLMEKQANHIFELKPDRIKPSLETFIEKLKDYDEETISKDDFSETRIIQGNGLVGEYTIINGKVIIHVLISRRNT
ncbi:MAG: hypothetical protein ACTSRU_11620, partial [Candidatus Hodarchaeales archaeon]